MLVLSLLMLSLSPSTHAAPGDLDPSFDPDGIAGFDLVDIPGFIGSPSAPDEARAVVTQPDGKVVVAGYAENLGDDDFALLRYNPDGSLDPSFDFNGLVITHFGGDEPSNERINALARQPDGKLVAAGFTELNGVFDLALARYNVDGSLDGTFDGNGLRCCLFEGNDAARAVVVQPDGKLVVAGFTDEPGLDGVSDLDFALSRYLPDGSLDASFGVASSGSIIVRFLGFNPNEAGHALVQQPDGRLVVAGFTDVGGSRDFALVRLVPDGRELDPSFFTTGATRISFGTNVDQGNALVLQPDGRLVTAGFSNNGSESSFALVRLNPDGALDASFG
ncbi:MAG: delta-60 repeat domain-containing protein, partial [bacterium]